MLQKFHFWKLQFVATCGCKLHGFTFSFFGHQLLHRQKSEEGETQGVSLQFSLKDDCFSFDPMSVVYFLGENTF